MHKCKKQFTIVQKSHANQQDSNVAAAKILWTPLHPCTATVVCSSLGTDEEKSNYLKTNYNSPQYLYFISVISVIYCRDYSNIINDFLPQLNVPSKLRSAIHELFLHVWVQNHQHNRSERRWAALATHFISSDHTLCLLIMHMWHCVPIFLHLATCNLKSGMGLWMRLLLGI